MSEPRSRRARILKNLQRQLETITVANGYTIDVVKVTTDVKNWNDTSAAETPVLYLIDEHSTPTYAASRHVEWEWKVGVFGVMKDKSQLQMEELISDIMDCLFANATLSFDGIVPGPLAQVRIGDITTDNQLFSEIDGSQLFKVLLSLKYTACANISR
jgi:hypothetical protein